MKTFPKIYKFEVEVDSNYPAVHNLFMHQTVFIRYTYSSNGEMNKAKYQPDPMVREDARILEEEIKRLGVKVKVSGKT
jgi:hypothetical protein